jgi:molybdate transport system regulatory protein
LLVNFRSASTALTIYRAIERDAERAVAKRLPQLLALIRQEAGTGA